MLFLLTYKSESKSITSSILIITVSNALQQGTLTRMNGSNVSMGKDFTNQCRILSRIFQYFIFRKISKSELVPKKKFARGGLQSPSPPTPPQGPHYLYGSIN